MKAYKIAESVLSWVALAALIYGAFLISPAVGWIVTGLWALLLSFGFKVLRERRERDEAIADTTKQLEQLRESITAKWKEPR